MTTTSPEAAATVREEAGSAAVWRGPEVAIVHDWIGGVHGAEQVLRELALLFPAAPILTLFADRRCFGALGIDPSRVRESYLGRLPQAVRLRRFLLPWLADAVQTLDVGDAALIVSSSHAVAKSVPHRSWQRHLAYVYSPMRYAHDLMSQYLRSVPGPLRPWVRAVLRRLGTWDVATANRANLYVAISGAVAERIWRTYRRRAEVLHPPVDVGRIPIPAGGRGDYYVVLSRLVGYKRIDLAIRAAASVGGRLVVVGEGPERARLESLARTLRASKVVEFVGWVPDATKHALLGNARALLFPGEEDFGIVGVEALAAGTPVVALGRGGMLDVLGATSRPVLGDVALRAPGGVLVGAQTADALARGIRLLEEGAEPDRAALRALAERFATARFGQRMLALARRVLDRG